MATNEKLKASIYFKALRIYRTLFSILFLLFDSVRVFFFLYDLYGFSLSWLLAEWTSLEREIRKTLNGEKQQRLWLGVEIDKVSYQVLRLNE